MTREELQDLKRRIRENKYLTKTETDYIIRALEQEPCEDVISRADAILQIQRHGVGCFDSDEFSPEICERFVIDLISKLPSYRLECESKEPCEDVISRQAVLKLIKERCNPYGKPNIDFEEGKKLLKYIDNLPPVNPQPKTGHWIPVSERLPESEGLYLVSVRNEHGRRYSKTCWFDGHRNWFARQDVIAWMPLPNPFEPQESEGKK